MRKTGQHRIGAVALAGWLSAAAGGCSAPPPNEGGPLLELQPAVEIDDVREPCAERNELRNAYFGETHVHTGLSFDARSRDVQLSQDEAYAYARGEEVRLPPLDDRGQGTRRVRIDQPLDFAAITDHAETLAETALCVDPSSPAYPSATCKALRGEGLRLWLARIIAGSDVAPHLRLYYSFLEYVTAERPERIAEVCGPGGTWCARASDTLWKGVQRSAERAYDRSSACEFSSFVAYEYTASPNASNLHRNVIFRGASVPDAPVAAADEPTPYGLWERLRRTCIDAGGDCDALAIPHNSNWSGGRMFLIEYPGAQDTSEQAAQARARSAIEPIVEIYQHKGDSECRNGLAGVASGPDELCDFEKLRPPGEPQEDCGDGYDPDGGGMSLESCLSPRDFVRYALIEGLREEARIGANPFKFGLIAATDSHTGTPGAVEERSFHGGFGAGDDTPAGRARLRGHSAGGLAGVWAEENTREAIFDAMRRRETFGTSGPRIVPRLFGGWDYPVGLCDDPELVAKSYAGGVPMGGDLPAAPERADAPSFVVTALRDPGAPGRPGAPLQRVQIVKGWVGTDGLLHQRVFDAVGPPVDAAGVDPDTCRTSGSGFDWDLSTELDIDPWGSSGGFGTRFRADGPRRAGIPRFERLAPVGSTLRVDGQRLAGRTGNSPSRWRAVGPPRDVPRRVHVAVEFQPTPVAPVDPDREFLRHSPSAPRAVRRGVVRGDEVHPPTGAFGLFDEQLRQRRPALFVDRPVQTGLRPDLGSGPISRSLGGPDQVGDPQALQGDPIEPRDQRTGQLVQLAAVAFPSPLPGPGERRSSLPPAVGASLGPGQLALMPADRASVELPGRDGLAGRQSQPRSDPPIDSDGVADLLDPDRLGDVDLENQLDLDAPGRPDDPHGLETLEVGKLPPGLEPDRRQTLDPDPGALSVAFQHRPGVVVDLEATVAALRPIPGESRPFALADSPKERSEGLVQAVQGTAQHPDVNSGDFRVFPAQSGDLLALVEVRDRLALAPVGSDAVFEPGVVQVGQQAQDGFEPGVAGAAQPGREPEGPVGRTGHRIRKYSEMKRSERGPPSQSWNAEESLSS